SASRSDARLIPGGRGCPRDLLPRCERLRSEARGLHAIHGGGQDARALLARAERGGIAALGESMSTGNVILLVEDDADDEHLTLRVLTTSKIASEAVVARHGGQALRGANIGRDQNVMPHVIDHKDGLRE